MHTHYKIFSKSNYPSSLSIFIGINDGNDNDNDNHHHHERQPRKQQQLSRRQVSNGAEATAKYGRTQ
jgi:hypothetical protein